MSEGEARRGASGRRVDALGVAALALVCVAGYANSFDGIFAFDDYPNILRNPFIRWDELSFDNLIRAFLGSPDKRPIASASFGLNYYFGAYEVAGYHAVNLLIHFLNAVLVYALAKQTFALTARLPSQSRPLGPGAMHAWAALFAALVFAAHPIQTQSVTYIVQRMNELAVLFYLGALLCYIHGRLTEGSRRAVWWSCAFASWLLALGCKQIAATLPAALWLYEWLFFRDASTRWARRNLQNLIAPLSLLLILLYVYAGATPLAGYARRDFTLGERLLTEPRVVFHYLSLIALPLPSRQSLLSEFPVSHSLFDPPSTALAIAGLAGLLGMAGLLLRRQRVLAFGVLWFLGHHVLESSVLPLRIHFEHRNYLPLVGISLLLGQLLGSVLAGRPAAARARVGALIAVPIAALLVGFTHTRNEVWRSREALWGDVLAKNPGEPIAHANYGLALGSLGQHADASHHFREAIRIDPEYAPAYRNLGESMLQQGQPDAAFEYYTEATRLEPNDSISLGALAALHVRRGELEAAVAVSKRSLQSHLDEQVANRLGSILATLGRFEEADHYYTLAKTLAPQYRQAFVNHGVALAAQNRHAEAIEQFRAAMRLGSDAQSHVHLANSLWQTAHPTEAIRELREALLARPDWPIPANNLAWMLATCPDADLRAPEEALRIANASLADHGIRDAGLLDTIAAAHAAAGRFALAVEIASEAARNAASDPPLAAEIRERIALYQTGRAYIDAVAAGTR